MELKDNKISVVIPVRNGAQSLTECLNSVLNQSVVVYEYIIVDNNSTDATANIVKEYQIEHKNLVYLLEKIPGRGSARNAGIYKSTGNIIVMTDVDCIVAYDWIEKITAPIVLNQEILVVGGEYDISKNYWSRHTQKMYDYLRDSDNSLNLYTPFIDTKNFAVLAQLVRDISFDARFKASEDEEIMFRLRQFARFRYLPNVKVGHRHAQSLRTVSGSAYERAYWFAQIYHKFNGVYDTNGVLIFPTVPPFWFYARLLIVNIGALRAQGLSHLLYFLVYDLSSKLGSAVGFAYKQL